MSTTPLVIALVLFFVANTLFHAALLWLTCKLFRARIPLPGPETASLPIRYGRALLATVLMTLLSAALLLVYFKYLMPYSDALPLLLGFAIGPPVLSWLLLLLVLRLRPFKGFLVMITWDSLVVGSAVALVLFVLKPFLFDAFVIPLGSMAPTLQGYHKDIVCPQCDHAFAINASDEAEPIMGMQVRALHCRCPHCDVNLKLTDPERERGVPQGWKANDDTKEIADPGLKTGDRMLVVKGPLTGEFPQRMGLAVFDHPTFNFGSTSFNPRLVYVKRVVGMPDETVAIHTGNLYRLDGSKGARHEAVEFPVSDRFDQPGTNLPEALDRFREGQFEILRKSPAQLLDPRHLVYDNDHPAKDLLAPEHQRWKTEEKGWEKTEERGFRFSDKGDALRHVTYRHLRRTDEGNPSLITDVFGYNSGPRGRGLVSENWVGDLLLECEVNVEKAEGVFLLELVKAGERFQAVWDLSSGACELRRIGKDDKEESLGRQLTKLTSGTHLIRWANVDDRLTLWVGESLPFSDGVDYRVAKDRKPTALDLSPARIGAKNATVTVRHIKLFRDTYHTVDAGMSDVNVRDWTDPEQWEGLIDPPVRTMYVQPRHYFVLGDNPNGSADSRTWGLVPERHLKGKPVLRYYPWPRFGALR